MHCIMWHWYEASRGVNTRTALFITSHIPLNAVGISPSHSAQALSSILFISRDFRCSKTWQRSKVSAFLVNLNTRDTYMQRVKEGISSVCPSVPSLSRCSYALQPTVHAKLRMFGYIQFALMFHGSGLHLPNSKSMETNNNGTCSSSAPLLFNRC
jgi:hypothetical protein